MYTKLLLVLVALPLLVNCQPTHCGGWKGSSQFRCAKDNYGADSIHIRNIINSNVSFRVGKWLSKCGKAGTNYSDGEHRLGPRESYDETFMEAGGSSCNEMFIYACKRESQDVNCVDVITPSVN